MAFLVTVTLEALVSLMTAMLAPAEKNSPSFSKPSGTFKPPEVLPFFPLFKSPPKSPPFLLAIRAPLLLRPTVLLEVKLLLTELSA